MVRTNEAGGPAAPTLTAPVSPHSLVHGRSSVHGSVTPGITDQAELEADAKAAPKLSESEIAALEAKALSMVKQNPTGWQVIENGNVVYTFTTYKKAIEVARTMVGLPK